MPIRFPRMHIAESVANRLLNLADDMRTGGFIPPAEPTPPPEVPGATALEGAKLDQALGTPPAEDLQAPPGLLTPGGLP